MERGPGFFVDLCLEGGFQGSVGIIGAEEISVANEETLFPEELVRKAIKYDIQPLFV